MQPFSDIAFDRHALEHQRRRGSYDSYQQSRAQPAPDGLGDAEIEFLSQRDSFYLASVGSNGWPYVQHRGGPPGFVRVVDPTHLAWADRSGNRQFVTAGHIDHDDRVAIIAVDYPNRQRMKLLGHARFDPDPERDLLDRLGIDGRLEGLVTVEVIAFDWNCPKYITPRFTADEVRAVIEPLPGTSRVSRGRGDTNRAPEPVPPGRNVPIQRPRRAARIAATASDGPSSSTVACAWRP